METKYYELNYYGTAVEEKVINYPDRLLENGVYVWWNISTPVAIDARKPAPALPAPAKKAPVKEPQVPYKAEPLRKVKTQNQPPQKVVPGNCNNCIHRKNGSCPQLRNILCEDFRAVPSISYGDRL